MCGLYNNFEGRILLNGLSSTTISNDFFSNNISVVPQNSTLFNKTVKENITLGKKIEENEIWKALELVKLKETIKQLPMGLNTIISDNGSNFSGGQGQRLAIARAIVKKPTFLILDESTSSLDSINEIQIYKNLRKMKITLLIISHRLSTVMDSDKIYVLNEGRIVEEGMHEDLLKEKGIYYDLYCEQHKEDEDE